jgi:hypothetical protein
MNESNTLPPSGNSDDAPLWTERESTEEMGHPEIRA